MADSFVSIIVPNYNKAPFIAETLQSLLAQTHSEWEAIIVDDNSTDHSWEIITEYAAKDSRFRPLKNESGRSNGSVCRNIGIEAARGAYIIFLDSDDLLVPSCIENRLKYSGDDLDMSIFSMASFFTKIGDGGFSWQPTKHQTLEKFLSHQIVWAITCPLWKTEFLVELGGFDESFPRLQDVELHTRALLKEGTNYEVHGEGEPDCFYRRESSRTNQSAYDRELNQLDGSLRYVTKFSEILMVSSQKQLVRYLRGTLLAATKSISISKWNNEISMSEFTKLRMRMRNSPGSQRVMNWHHWRIVDTYAFAARMCGPRLRRADRLFYKLLLSV